MSEIKLYKDNNYQGGELDAESDIADFAEYNFTNVLTSLIVDSGTWTLFEKPNYQGFSVTVSPHGGPNSDGRYPSSGWIGARNDAFNSLKKNSTHG